MYNLPAHARRLRADHLEHLPGFPSLSRHHLEASTAGLAPDATRTPVLPWLFRPRRFARPRRLAPIRDLQVCFTPLPRLGFRLQGFAPRVKPTDSSPAFTLMSLTANACRETTVAHNHSAPALTISPSGSCSSHGSVVRNWGFSPAHHSIPSWVFLLRASLRTRPG
jgi:hypothetical protein